MSVALLSSNWFNITNITPYVLVYTNTWTGLRVISTMEKKTDNNNNETSIVTLRKAENQSIIKSSELVLHYTFWCVVFVSHEY